MQSDLTRQKRYVVEEEDSILVPKINLEESKPSGIRSFPDKKNPGLFKNFSQSGISKFVSLVTKFGKKGDSETDSVSGSKPKKKISKKLLVFFSILVLFLLIQGSLAFRVYQKGMAVKVSGEALIASANSQDLEKVKQEISKTKISLEDFKKSYATVSWLRFVPFVGKYVADGQNAINAGKYGLESLEIVIGAVEPYADIIGFTKGSQQAESGTETAQDRLDFIVKTLPDLVPKADELTGKVNLVKREIDQVNPDDYPSTLGKFEVQDKVRKIVELTDLVAEMVKNGKPLLEVSPFLLGVDSERTYLVLFQNDKELRPTGGFITAYSIAKVRKGKFEPVLSDDIYNLDNKYKPSIEAPQPIIDYIKGPYLLSDNLRLRDMNWSPDFSQARI
ncbi:DUF4012 domain-containing protein [Patescibacteria group bacterium]|nr:DUF4012 domain-containing protein [Patescibacteria group bacterium]